MTQVRTHPLPIQFAGEAGPLAADRWPADNPRGSVVMLHGGGQTRHSWDHAACDLAADRWTVYTVDARGHGDSAWSPEGDYGIDALVRDTQRVLEQIPGIDDTPGVPPVLVGASVGGMTSIVAEGEFGPCARALVLVDITPRAEPDGVRRISEFMRGAPNGFDSLEDVADAVAAYQPHRARPANIEGLRKNVRMQEDGRLYWHWDPQFHRSGSNLDDPVGNYERLVRAAARITVPTLLIRGGKSDVVSLEGVAELRALIPHAIYASAVDAGHMVAGDDNAVFVSEVAEFLDHLT
ncbi:alpha/beta fold hydrolase [Rhodococcus rhodochrous]|uniref:AB hydrolase-1 domain-containing protein n=1 Tax=Rhodococcus rhodochrous KG-21 TaxID=1441923 RepID=A0A0M8PLQ8_RHORH|nr:alpha/beta fold hydrolase [Rhodococcus rhodochrous]KOS55252.1 hypothetical protein Z051_15820 [Rhodococcus rhodochrous KG-21]